MIDTLPDYLKPDLDIVFIGLNPSTISVNQGHYFANPRNRFWKALNMSGLIPVEITHELDSQMLDHGIGLTDLIKRPTPQATGLTPSDYKMGAPVLKEKLVLYKPKLACFHGMLCYKAFLKYSERITAKPDLGLQSIMIDQTSIFVVPNPSPANAKYSLEDISNWYKLLGQVLQKL